MLRSTRRRILFLCAILSTLPAYLAAQPVPQDYLDALRFRYIGPVGNRISSVAGVPGDPLTYYVGAASGGLWKSEDGGVTWKPKFDKMDVHSVGALAVAPSDPQVVWAGTGEPHIRSNVTIGNGVYRSTDGGEHWEHMGLDETGRISRIVIHPTNPDIVYVAALGHTHSPQEERGIFRTLNGGETWEQVLFVDENTGASSLIMDPNNPRILFAGMWQITTNTWGRESGGPGSGIYMSRDGGDTWRKLEGHGLPKLPVGKIDVCMSPADSRIVYALIETGDGVPWHGRETESGELWRSDDAGHHWKLVNHSRDLGGRTAYYNQCRVSTDDPMEAYFLTSGFARTLDGGKTYVNEQGPRRPGGDHHDMWIDPTNADRMIVVHDQGLSISLNRGETWHQVQLPVAQMYHVTADNDIPYHVLGNRQDGPSTRGPSNSLYFGFRGGFIPRGDWHSVGGGESGYATPDPTDPNIVWSSASGSGARGGIVVRYDERTRQFRNVEVWPESTGGWPAEDLKYRFQWTFPLLISPHDHNTIYVTSQVVHRTRNGGQSWEVISPDLTTNDKSRQGISGGLTPDNIGVEYCCVIYAFDESPARQGVFYAGSNDGKVHVSTDDGATWTDVTGNFPDWPKDGVVRGIDASRWDAGTAYLVVEAHQVGNFKPYAYRTRDYGKTWTRIVDGIPLHPLSFTRSIQEDSERQGLLFLGTENRIYVSFDDGDHWQPLINNMPPAPIYGMVVQDHFDDLVIGTYGRGFWILDDITPLQQLSGEIRSAAAHLFRPRDAYRFQSRTSPWSMPNDMTVGQNPPYGASLNYWLSPDLAGKDVTVTIAEPSGKVVRTLHGKSEAGLNRLWWNLRDEASTPVRMRTTPLYADWVDLGPDRVRVAAQGMSILRPPGVYTVTLSVGDQTMEQELSVLKDPDSEGTQADIEEQTALLEQLRSDFDEAARAVNRIEWIRRQLQDLGAVLAAREDGDDLVAAARDLEKKFIEVEGRLFQLKVTGTGQDRVRYPARIIGRLQHLAGGIATSDFRPTDQQREVLGILEGRLRDSVTELNALLEGPLPEFNRTLADRGLGPVIVVEEPGG
ncbi:MAG: sialidase [Gemmatimonadota bacterium]